MDEMPMDEDYEMMMDGLSSECMDAFEKKDKDKLIDCLHAMISNIVSEMEE